jgi:hypothetical protein
MAPDEARRDRRRDRAEAAHVANMKPTVPKLDRDRTMRVVAEEWIDNRIKSSQWKCLTHPGQVRQRLRDHVYPVVGHQPAATSEVLKQPDGMDTRTFWLATRPPPISPSHRSSHQAAICAAMGLPASVLVFWPNLLRLFS